MYKLLIVLVGFIFFVSGVNAQYSGSFQVVAMTDEQGMVINGIEEGHFFGAAVSSIGDFNNDGIDDIGVGQPNNNGGRAYVVYGNGYQPDNPLNPNLINGGNGFAVSGNPGTGTTVSSAGDFNGDGIDDLLVGVSYSDTVNMDDAIAYVLFGNNSPMPSSLNLNLLDPSEGIKINRPILNESPGFSVSEAGDFNFDGIDDILVSSLMSDDAHENAGTVYLIFGSNNVPLNPINLDEINGTNGIVIYGGDNWDRAGHSMAACGDFDGDGIDDVLIATDGAQDQYKGHVYLIYGSQNPTHPLLLANLNNNQVAKIIGEGNYNFAGIGLDGNLDFNADGYQDILIGAPDAFNMYGDFTGMAYVVYGSPTFPNTFLLSNLDINSGIKLNGIVANDNTGRDVSNLGDFNGDGIDDVIVGAPNSDQGGWATVFYGRKNPPAYLDTWPLIAEYGFRIQHSGVGNSYARSVSSAGDFNNDGIDDALIGSPYNIVDGTDDVGTAFIVYGNDGIFSSSF